MADPTQKLYELADSWAAPHSNATTDGQRATVATFELCARQLKEVLQENKNGFNLEKTLLVTLLAELETMANIWTRHAEALQGPDASGIRASVLKIIENQVATMLGLVAAYRKELSQ